MKHCMIVDDSDVIRKVARQLFEKMSFMVSEAENGQDALERCRARMPELLMVDWHMPVMNGIEFISALRLEKDGKKPHVIYCATEYDVDDINAALESGANDFILKPYDRRSIEAKLNGSRAN